MTILARLIDESPPFSLVFIFGMLGIIGSICFSAVTAVESVTLSESAIVCRECSKACGFHRVGECSADRGCICEAP